MAAKKSKKIKVQDLKPKKDAKGGNPRGPLSPRGNNPKPTGPGGPRPDICYFGGLTN